MAEPVALRLLWALRKDRDLSATEWRVAVALVAHINVEGKCNPSVATIARVARTSPGAVRRALRRIEDGAGPVGLVVERNQKSDDGDPTSHIYTLAPRKGSDHPDPTPDHPDPTVGSPRPQGSDHPDRGVGSPRPRKKDLEEGHEKKDTGEGASRSRRWTRVPAEWQPSEQHRQLATERGADFVLELAKFRDCEFKVPKSDADAAFRNWLRRIDPPQGYVPPRGPTPEDPIREVRKRLEDRVFAGKSTPPPTAIRKLLVEKGCDETAAERAAAELHREFFGSVPADRCDPKPVAVAVNASQTAQLRRALRATTAAIGGGG